MRRKFKSVFFIALVSVVLFSFRTPAEKYFEIAKSLDIFTTLFKEVNTYYVDEVEPNRLIRKSIKGMLESLDPYTSYIPEDEIEAFRISTTGQYGGVGALIGLINNKTVITHPYRDFPAFRAGIKVGDEIIAVDGQLVQSLTPSQVSALLKGQPKTEVEIKIKRYAQADDLIFKIKREKIHISNIPYFGMIDAQTGYIKLDDFTSGASREVSDAVNKLKDKGAKSLILDLRENPGGLLHEAVNIVSLFIPKGKEVVSTKGKVKEWNKAYTTLNNPIDSEIPLTVLVSEGSASASEIVAGALQDYDRAVLVGEKTFGKGLVQITRPLAYNSQLKVTTAKYYIPSGRCIQALDYAHRHEDGTVDRFADSLKTEHKTMNGRAVFDGDGLNPDVTVNEGHIESLANALVSSGYVFEFSSQYCATHLELKDPNNFNLSDEAFQDFITYLNEKNFTYTSAVETTLNELMEITKKELVYDELETEIKMLQQKVQYNKSTDFQRFKNEIKNILEVQIAFNYSLNEGQTGITLQRDEVVKEACKVLHDTSLYNKILFRQK